MTKVRKVRWKNTKTILGIRDIEIDSESYKLAGHVEMVAMTHIDLGNVIKLTIRGEVVYAPLADVEFLSIVEKTEKKSPTPPK